MKRILVLFANDWDRGELERPKYRNDYQFLYEGTDFFKFPGALKLLSFRAGAYIDRLARRYAERFGQCPPAQGPRAMVHQHRPCQIGSRAFPAAHTLNARRQAAKPIS